jgi:hypothetical protein
MSANESLKKGKKLDRAMVNYAIKTRNNLDISFREALEQMKTQADRVAKDMEVSETFVIAWTTNELARGPRS